MSERISLSEPLFEGNEWEYVKECIDTGWVSSAGKYVDLFEQKISEYTGAKYAVATVNGTSALHLSLIICGVEEGDEVIVPSVTFIAPINAVKYVGANPVFMDCDDFYNIDVNKTIEFIMQNTIVKNGYSYNKKTGNRISAMIPVHVFGNAVFLEDLVQICKERNIKIIEDATESLGTKYIDGKYKGYHTGTIGDVGCISFNGNKIITTGGGGMLLTNNKVLADRARYLSTQAKDDSLYYIHNEVGFNYRLTNIQAALGVAQLEQLEKFLKRKKEIYYTYKELLKDVDGITLSDVPDYAENNHWLNTIKVDEKEYGKTRDDLIELFLSNNIEVRPVWRLNHLQRSYKNLESFKINRALKIIKTSISLPSSSNLQNDKLQKIIDIL